MKQPYQITRVSPFTNKAHTMELTFDMEDYNKWKNGELIQNALSYLTPDEREFLMTGITAEEWDKTFKKEADEQDDN